eukprot:Opistho-2@27076
MELAMPAAGVSASIRNRLFASGALLLGVASLYGPTFFDLFNGLWKTDQNGHGPIVLAVAMWFLWHKSREIARDSEPCDLLPAPLLGWTALIFGALLYILGRSQAIYLFEVGSIIPVLAGTVLILFGSKTLGRLWFSFFFMLFMIPLPGSVVDAVTQPMKLAVSVGSEYLLHVMGYPIARSGVVLTIPMYSALI